MRSRAMRAGLAFLVSGVLWSGVLAPPPAAAQPVFYVVDTGNGASSGGLTLTVTQSLAAQFSLPASYEISGLEGWMVYLNLVNNLPVYAVVYGDDGNSPDVGNELFRQIFFVPPSGFAPGWHGVDGVSLALGPGTYWLAFEVNPGAIGSGAMPPTATQMLDFYAVDPGSGWAVNETANLGVRVRVPEPRAAVSTGAAVAVLAALARHRSRRRASAG